MFTGLIEEIGIIKQIIPVGGGRQFTIEAKNILNDMKIDDSISINGACQTVVKLSSNSFDVVAVEETIRKSTLGDFRVGQKVHLERAMSLHSRFGGHIVQGHVDCVGYVVSIIPELAGTLVWFSFPDEFRKYLVPVGSIAVDGVSLTVAKIEGSKFMVSVIPHTWQKTLLKNFRSGTKVNLEFDIIGKYVENLLKFKSYNNNDIDKSILDKFLNNYD